MKLLHLKILLGLSFVFLAVLAINPGLAHAAAPSATIGTPAQVTASTSVVFTANFTDSDSDVTSSTVEYSTDNTIWASTTLGLVTASQGTVATSTGGISSIDTNASSTMTLTITWMAGTDLASTSDSTVYLRIIPSDATLRGATSTSASFALDTLAPAGFQTGAVSAVGGTVVVSTWNATNTSATIAVPVANDSTLTDGTIQIRADRGDGYVNVGSPYTILVGDLSTTVTITVSAAALEGIANFAEADVISFKAFITDAAGNTKLGGVSVTTLTVDQTAPAIPDNFSAAPLTISTVTLVWDAVAAANSYDIYQSDTLTGTYTRLGSEPTISSSSTVTYTVTGLTTSQMYYWKITSWDASGNESARSGANWLIVTQAGTSGGGGSSGGGGGGGSSGGGSSASTPVTITLTPGPTAISNLTAQQQLAALLAQLQTLQAQLNAQQGNTNNGAVTFTKVLRLGSQNADVTALQTILEAKGFLKMPSGVAKGYFGGITKAALMKYQKSIGLSQVGELGPATRAALNSGR